MKKILDFVKYLINQGNKTKSIVTAISILFIASMIISAVPIKAQGANEELHGQTPTQQGYIGQTIVPTGATANYTIYPLALLSITLNPVGVGQDALVKHALI